MGDAAAQGLTSIQAFVLRARRVRQHSLSQDQKLLAALRQPQFTLKRDAETGRVRTFFLLPSEELIESAAARVRPLLLQGEDTFHGKVMKGVLFYANQHEAPSHVVNYLRELKKAWAAVNPKSESFGYYEVSVLQGDDAEKRLSDNSLAFAWIYGDVVHADRSRRDEGRAFGVEERFRAAIPVVIRLIDLTLITLNIVEQMHEESLLPDLSGVFDEDVVVTQGPRELDAEVYVGSYDAEGNAPGFPALDGPLGPEWTRIEDAFGDLASGSPSAPSGDES